MPWKLKKLLSLIIGSDRVFNRWDYRPDFDEPGFDAPGFDEPGFEGIDAFLQDMDSKFLLTQGEIDELRDTFLRKHGDAAKSIVTTARELCEKALPIYSIATPGISNGFSWKTLKKGPENDVLYLVKPHRFSFYGLLSQACLFDESLIEDIDRSLQEWMLYSSRTNYSWPYFSNLVVMYRIVALTWAWNFIAAGSSCPSNANDKRKTLARIFSIIHSDIKCLEPRLGHSHPNNHLLADYFIGWFIDSLYNGCLVEGQFSRYEQLWCAELERQFYDDGGHFEQSTHYQELCAQMAVYYYLMKRANGEILEPGIEKIIQNVIYAAANFAPEGPGNWHLGDFTEDSLFPTELGVGCTHLVFKQLYSSLFGDCSNTIDQDSDGFSTAFWLLKSAIGREKPTPETPTPETPANSCKIENFPESGMYRISNASGFDVLFRTGIPARVKFQQGHANSDFLSLSMAYKGCRVLPPPGTGTYMFSSSEGANFRAYFAGRESQTALMIDSLDPLGPIESNFRSMDNKSRCNTVVSGAPELGYLIRGAIHSTDSYSGTSRCLIAGPEGCFIIVDRTKKECISSTRTVNWQFDPGCHISIGSNGSTQAATSSGGVFLIPFSSMSVPTIYEGSVSPVRGWVSRSYGEIVPAANTAYRVDSNTTTSAFLITDEANSKKSGLNLSLIQEDLIRLDISSPGRNEIIFLCDQATALVSAQGLPTFLGNMLRLSYQAQELESISCFAINKLKWKEYGLNLDFGDEFKDFIVTFSAGKPCVDYIESELK